MQRVRYRVAPAALCLLLAAGCSVPLARCPVTVSGAGWEMTLLRLDGGPDQYLTAGGYRRPREGKQYVWATVRFRNHLRTPLVIRLDRIYMKCRGERMRPCVIDSDCFITVRAKPAPRLRPGEAITRRLAYALPRLAEPEGLSYERREATVNDAGPR